MSTLLRRCLLAALVVGAAAAVLAAGAQAKGLTGLTVCGANRCVDRTTVIEHSAEVRDDLLSGGVGVADPGPASFVRFKEHIGHGGEDIGTTSVVYFPAFGTLLFEDGTYHRPAEATRRALARALTGVTAFPASKLGVRHVAPSEPAATPEPAAGAPAAPGDGGGDAGGGSSGGLSTAAWIAAGAAAAAGLLMMLWRRRPGRPATG